MAATSRGIKKFKEWLAVLDEQGWKDEHRQWLVDYWWKHHDDDGNLYPSGQVRECGDKQ
jgi:hypothetical protein